MKNTTPDDNSLNNILAKDWRESMKSLILFLKDFISKCKSAKEKSVPLNTKANSINLIKGNITSRLDETNDNKITNTNEMDSLLINNLDLPTALKLVQGNDLDINSELLEDLENFLDENVPLVTIQDEDENSILHLCIKDYPNYFKVIFLVLKHQMKNETFFLNYFVFKRNFSKQNIFDFAIIYNRKDIFIFLFDFLGSNRIVFGNHLRRVSTSTSTRKMSNSSNGSEDKQAKNPIMDDDECIKFVRVNKSTCIEEVDQIQLNIFDNSLSNTKKSYQEDQHFEKTPDKNYSITQKRRTSGGIEVLPKTDVSFDNMKRISSQSPSRSVNSKDENVHKGSSNLKGMVVDDSVYLFKIKKSILYALGFLIIYEKTKINNCLHWIAKSNSEFFLIFLYEKFSIKNKSTVTYTHALPDRYSSKHNRYDYLVIRKSDKRTQPHPHLSMLKNYINQSNAYGVTPLQYACFFENKKMTDLFLDMGANINHMDLEGNSVINYAIKNSNYRLCKKLLIRGADPDIKNENKQTSREFAFSTGTDEKIKRLFKKVNCFSAFLSVKPEIIIPHAVFKYDYLMIIVSAIYTFFSILCIGIIISVALQISEVGTNQHNLNSKSKFKFADFIIEILMSSASVLINITLLLAIKCIQLFNDPDRKRRRTSKSNDESNLITLFNNDPNVCIICRRPILFNTIHCIKCNVCVDDWDHHCFWLDVCVSESNKRQFSFFLYLAIACILVNLTFYGWVSLHSLLFGYHWIDEYDWPINLIFQVLYSLLFFMLLGIVLLLLL